jgi:hypothetical protein
VQTGAKRGSALTDACDRRLFPAPGGRIVGVVGSPLETSYVAVGLWDVVADRRLAVLPDGSQEIVFAPDGRTGYVVLSGGAVAAMVVPGGGPRELPGLGPAGALALRADSAVLAVRRAFSSSVALWDVAAGALSGHFDLPGVTALPSARPTFAPDGRLLLLAPHSDRHGLYDVASGRLAVALPLAWTHIPGEPRFAAGGRALVTISSTGLRAWALPEGDGEATPLFEGRAEGVDDAWPLPDGRLLTFSRRDGRVRIWPAEVFRP